MTLSFSDSNAAHLIITFIVSDEIMPPETVSHTMVLRRKNNHCWILGKLFGLNSKLKQRKAEKSTLSWINRKTGRLVLYQWETSGSVRASSAEFCYPILE